MKSKIKLLLIAFITLCSSSGFAQDRFLFTKAFDAKLAAFNLEYIKPAKLFLHPVPHQDEYDEYDLVLYAENQKIEVRYIFRDDTSPIGLSAMPHLEFYRSIIDFASNEGESNQIMIQDMLPEIARDKYHADWCLIADFTPKASISIKPNGRILGIYKEETGLIFCMVFFDDELPDYFELPIRFAEVPVFMEE